ncbi:hypothetical protein HWB99_gp087 [Mycobacterium phage DrLupo]|uniref:Uncharacterized protein n=1 Tax=Mycobacterium phage DrLupo TaxID=2499037 RepID=A0A3S9UQR1_9CAUD|nr:hypothetical protein HWB99_gp087 [Mycobacterium phage DrLupo]AZS12623.1 hypothetical protein SEA_DRLUPO_87 [Mycobacterium phage DrLupo]
MGANEKLAAATHGKHTCHALRCNTEVPPKLLMCGKHWRMVPKPLQDRVWHHYRPGQEVTKDPSHEYIRAAMAAVNAVADKEGIPHGTTV